MASLSIEGRQANRSLGRGESSPLFETAEKEEAPTAGGSLEGGPTGGEMHPPESLVGAPTESQNSGLLRSEVERTNRNRDCPAGSGGEFPELHCRKLSTRAGEPIVVGKVRPPVN